MPFTAAYQNLLCIKDFAAGDEEPGFCWPESQNENPLAAVMMDLNALRGPMGRRRANPASGAAGSCEFKETWG
jgi:hypothetical protein